MGQVFCEHSQPGCAAGSLTLKHGRPVALTDLLQRSWAGAAENSADAARGSPVSALNDEVGAQQPSTAAGSTGTTQQHTRGGVLHSLDQGTVVRLLDLSRCWNRVLTKWIPSLSCCPAPLSLWSTPLTVPQSRRGSHRPHWDCSRQRLSRVKNHFWGSHLGLTSMSRCQVRFGDQPDCIPPFHFIYLNTVSVGDRRAPFIQGCSDSCTIFTHW